MTAPSLRRILYVEDDPDIQSVAKLILESVGGFTVEACESGNRAVKVAPDFEPDLILLDVMMPGMDGPTTLKALRTLPQTATTPVVFMTAKVQVHEVAQYKRLGAVDVIAKPFNPMSLSQLICDIWLRYHQT